MKDNTNENFVKIL